MLTHIGETLWKICGDYEGPQEDERAIQCYVADGMLWMDHWKVVASTHLATLLKTDFVMTHLVTKEELRLYNCAMDWLHDSSLLYEWIRMTQEKRHLLMRVCQSNQLDAWPLGMAILELYTSGIYMEEVILGQQPLSLSINL